MKCKKRGDISQLSRATDLFCKNLSRCDITRKSRHSVCNAITTRLCRLRVTTHRKEWCTTATNDNVIDSTYVGFIRPLSSTTPQSGSLENTCIERVTNLFSVTLRAVLLIILYRSTLWVNWKKLIYYYLTNTYLKENVGFIISRKKEIK